MKLLTTAELLAVVPELTPKEISLWCEAGVKPIKGGGSQGNQRIFSLMQAVGVGVAAGVRRSERGCALSYVVMIVEAFGMVSEEELRKQFDKGATHFFTVSGGKPILDGPKYDDMIDTRAIYNNVVKS